MNNQIVEISCEDLELVSGGGFKDGVKKFGKGLVKPLGFFGNTKSVWSYKDFGNCSLYNEHGDSRGFSWISALGTAITDLAIISGIMAAGNFVIDKIKAHL